MEAMEKHFDLTDTIIVNEHHIKLRQIKATRDSKHALLGDLGGYVESLDNLEDEAWVADKAQVWGNAKLSGNAWVGDNAQIWENAKVIGNAKISGKAMVSGKAIVCDSARVSGNAKISGKVRICDTAQVYSYAYIADKAIISGMTWVGGDTIVTDNAQVNGNTKINGNVWFGTNALIESDNDFCYFDKFGIENCSITTFKCSDGLVRVKCGRFEGTLEEFKKEIKEKYYNPLVEMLNVKFDL